MICTNLPKGLRFSIRKQSENKTRLEIIFRQKIVSTKFSTQIGKLGIFIFYIISLLILLVQQWFPK